MENLAREGLVRLEVQDGKETIEWIHDTAASPPLSEAAADPVSNRAFEILNHLEDMEARRINFGVFEAWSSPPEIARALGLGRRVVMDALMELVKDGYLLLDDDGRVRSRMAELAREVRYAKQRFRVGDSSRRPFLVRALKVELKSREKPARDIPLSQAMAELRDSIGGPSCRDKGHRGRRGNVATSVACGGPSTRQFSGQGASGLVRGLAGHSL